MNSIKLVKTATSFIVGAGTTKIVSSIIQNNVSPDNVADKVAVTGAAFVIGSMAADATRKYTDSMIDEAVTAYKNAVKKTA